VHAPRRLEVGDRSPEELLVGEHRQARRAAGARTPPPWRRVEVGVEVALRRRPPLDLAMTARWSVDASAAGIVDRDPDLLHRVALAHGDGAVVEAVEVDGDAVRRADLVLAAVARPMAWVSS
jgi:hypothetical protein